jgi:hypothetical protein
MNFNLPEALEMLERTPRTLESLLAGLSGPWLACREGEGTWSPSEVLDHLIEAEKRNWIPRVEWLLEHGEERPFPPFDRFAHLSSPPGRSTEERLAEFRELRAASTARLRALAEPERQLGLRGRHPEFGGVTLAQLLSTWVVHDLTHLSQIIRVMAKRYREDVGPWVQYLKILRQ